MLTVTPTPPLDEDLQRMQREATAASRVSWWQICVEFGATLILLPVFLAGGCITILQWCGIPKPASIIIGLVVGISIGAIQLMRILKDESTIRDANAVRRSLDRECGYVEVVKLSGITEAWFVDDLEDFGPGYMLRSRDDEFVYLAGEMLLDAEGEEVQPRESLEARRLVGTKGLQDVRWSGDLVPVKSSIRVGELPVEIGIECDVLPKAAVDRRIG